MDFGSGSVYDYTDSEEEEFCLDDKLEITRNQQRSKHHLEKLLPKSAKNSAQKSKKGEAKTRRARRADTNVICVKFGHLTSPSNMHTGDPLYCDGCGAVISHISSVSEEDDQTCWTCDFCNMDNIVDIEDEEKPKLDDVTYMLKPAQHSGVDQTIVVFCIDISGSMCVTTEIPGKHSLQGSHLDQLQSFNVDRASQFLPGQQRNVTFVSRLQSVQAAVDSQLADMAKKHPDRRVAVITFNSNVTIVGVGDTEDMHFAMDKLNNAEEMINAGRKLMLPQAVKVTHKKLSEKLYSLEEGGQTALGPALLLSVALASQIKGSKVVLCTDGMANTGIGSLDINSVEEFAAASEFYTWVSEMACDNGVTISLTTIKGTECKLAELGKITVNTGGQVHIVDPLKLTEEFNNILADSIIATNVQVTIILHKGLYFRDGDSKNSKVTRQIGNVTKDTEITFEYGIKNSYRRKKNRTELTADGETQHQEEHNQISEEGATRGAQSNYPLSDLKQLPFQLQLVYTDMEGTEAMRVLTQTKPITSDRKTAENEMNPEVIGKHGIKQSASLALAGRYSLSITNLFRFRNIFENNLCSETVQNAYESYLKSARPVDGSLRSIQESCEMSSDSEDDFDQAANELTSSQPPMPLAMSSCKKKKVMRAMACDDKHAAIFYEANRVLPRMEHKGGKPE